MTVSYRALCVLGLVALSCFVFQTTAVTPEIECNLEYYDKAIAMEALAPKDANNRVINCLLKTDPALTASTKHCPDGKTYYISTLLTGVLNYPMEFATCALKTLKELREPGVLAEKELAMLDTVEQKATDLFLDVFGSKMG